MSRKINEALIANAIDLVVNGSTAKHAANTVGVNYTTLCARLKKQGIKITAQSAPGNKISLPVDDIVSMYQNGESENSIASFFGVSRNVIRNRLISANVTPRTQSEAESLKWSKMDEEARHKQVKNAHDATRGSIRTDSAKESLAKARERIKYDHLIGPGEREFIEILNNRGIGFIHQKAIKFYNVDFAIGNIAVELTSEGGRYAMFNPKEIKRSKNLLECGYHVLAIEFNSIETLINCSDYIISAIDEMSRLEPFCSQYWVVGCRSQDYTITKNELGQFTSVPSPVKYVCKRSVIEF